jgi:hypothetical protein
MTSHVKSQPKAGRDDVPCEVAAESRVDVGHVVSARLQVVAFAGDIQMKMKMKN